MGIFFGVSPKLVAIVSLLLIFAREWKRGTLSIISRGLRSADKRPYLRGLGFLTVLSLSLVFADMWVLDLLRSDSSFLNAYAWFGGMLGRHAHPWLAAAVCYCAGIALRRGWVENLGRGMIFSGVLASAATFAFKFFSLRARPYAGLGPFSFFNSAGLFQDERNFQSFPSGDVAVVAAMSFFLFFSAKRSVWRWAFVLLPLATALSRISLNKHWPSDALFAAGLGLLAASLLWQVLRQEHPVHLQKATIV